MGERERRDRDTRVGSCGGSIGQKLFCLMFVSGLTQSSASLAVIC